MSPPALFNPPAFRETRTGRLHAAIDAIGFATLLSHTDAGPQVTHLPMMLVPDEGPCGTLYGHVARANTHARCAGSPALAMFLGPHAYVSAALYPGKRVHGREVPTWNYVAIHAHGVLETFEEPARLRCLLERLTDRHERDRAEPWRVADAPAGYLEAMLGAITGLRLPLDRLEGKYKLSQNRTPEERRSVRTALAASDDPLARAVAAMMDEGDRPVHA